MTFSLFQMPGTFFSPSSLLREEGRLGDEKATGDARALAIVSHWEITMYMRNVSSVTSQRCQHDAVRESQSLWTVSLVALKSMFATRGLVRTMTS